MCLVFAAAIPLSECISEGAKEGWREQDGEHQRNGDNERKREKEKERETEQGGDLSCVCARLFVNRPPILLSALAL